jgi:phage terminase large subunit
MSVEDGINAVRMTLQRCWFDFENTKEGLDALRQYRWAVNDKGESKNRPQHDWTSHSADAFRYLCTGLQETKNWSSRIEYPRLGIV